MQNPVPDERYSVADEAILGAFFKLLKKKTPDQITVSDITKTAGIARSTFYNHYQDIPSLVSAVEEKTIQDVFSIMEKFHPENDRDICQSYFLTICRYTMENPFLSSLLSTPHGNDLFEKMLHHYAPLTSSDPADTQRGNILCDHLCDRHSVFFTNGPGIILILHQKSLPEILTRVFTGMLPLLSRVCKFPQSGGNIFHSDGFSYVITSVSDFLCCTAYKRIFSDHRPVIRR